MVCAERTLSGMRINCDAKFAGAVLSIRCLAALGGCKRDIELGNVAIPAIFLYCCESGKDLQRR